MDEQDKEVLEDEELTVFGMAEMALDILRIVSVIAAMVFVAAGAFLAYDFFYFVRDVITKPEAVVASWQRTVVAFESPEPAGTPEGGVPMSAPPTPIVTPDPLPTPVLPEEGAGGAESAAPVLPSSPTESDAGGVTSEPERRPLAATPVQDPWLTFGERVLNHLETGDLGWVAGMAFLVALCWIMGKIPAVMLSTGTKVLVDLFKIGRS